jgi:ABC-type polysaccharide/polyol phosphate transport system ATPase subunit
VSADVLISVQGASKKFCTDLKRSLRYAVSDVARDLMMRRRRTDLRRAEFWALWEVSFELRRGEALAVMGANGAGKSTLLKLILGSVRLTGGRITTRGRLAVLSEHGLGFDPVLTGRENAYMSAAVLNIDRRRVDESFDEIVAFAGLEEFIDSPVQIYSNGMRARLGFSVAMYLEPDVLLVDEVLTVGDIGFQRRCIQHAKRYLEGGGSLVLVSHNPHLVQSICDRCLVLDRGKVSYDGSAVEGVARYFAAVSADPRDVLALDAALLKPLLGSAAIPRQPPARAASGSRYVHVDPSAESGLVIDDFGIEPLESDRLRTGEPARIYVRYRSAADLRVRWGFCFLTSDLETTIACDGPPEGFVVPAGSGEFAGTLSRLPLSGGRYALRVAIMDPFTELPFAMRGFHDAPGFFDVDLPASLRNNYRLFTNDLIALEDLTWERSHAASELAGGPASKG